MGLIDVLTSAAASRAHVLVAEAPGAFRDRVALERALDRMGWAVAESVADADVLAVVGEPGEAFAAVVEQVWAQMSEPRALVHLRAETEAEALLNEAREQIRGGAARVAGGHDHSAMMPDGIPLAEGAEDRDGLEMDELHLPLGPVLAHWPAGVVLRVTLHGDVVVDAEVEQLARPVAGKPDDAIVRAARLLDAAGSVLALAGLPAESARARRLRDSCLDGDRVGARDVARLGDRVGRRRVLRWVLGGLAVEGSHGGSEQLHDRLMGLFERARAELAGEAAPRVAQGAQALPTLVRGSDLAAVRLWVAAMMPDLAEHGLSEATHG